MKKLRKDLPSILNDEEEEYPTNYTD